MNINEYDLWFADHAGRNIRQFLEEADLPDPQELYESRQYPRWERDLDLYRRCLKRAEKARMRMIRLTDPEYPFRLKEIHDPPWVLFVRGELPDPDRISCAIVGARKATGYGLKMAAELGKILGENGVNVISGMALGADSEAHRGCLKGGGYTAAVLGSGADVCTPYSNRSLMKEILDRGGCVLSEQLPGTPGMPDNYPRRNRIISGISDCVIVVEADERSGTSITANMALEQGRDVYALPGNITSVMSRGTNRLIRDGAVPLISVESILEELDIETAREQEDKLPPLGKDEEIVYRTLKQTGMAAADELCALTGKTPGEVAGLLGVMEIKGLVLRSGGKIMIAK
ncbi:MAG: DNA-processing protein DprA [Firmicutes bacterium]|nr:DNA-processing protein DprA [Bacillota bacterium]